MRASDLQLDWLRAFVACVDAGSLSAAAPLLHRSQPAVSMQLKKLESALGQPLLSRGPRHFELTPAGRTLLDYARRLVSLHHEAVASLQGEALAGQLRLGVPDDFASRYMTPVLRRFASLHGAVEIELLCEQSTTLVPKVAAGEIDLALVSRHRGVGGTRLFRERLVWVGDPRHQAWRRTPLPVALYEPGSLARVQAVAALKAHRVAYRAVYNSASLAGQIAAVESGLAIAVLTECSVPPGLQLLLPRHGLPALKPLEVAVLVGKTAARRPAVQAMQALMVQTLQGAD